MEPIEGLKGAVFNSQVRGVGMRATRSAVIGATAVGIVAAFAFGLLLFNSSNGENQTVPSVLDDAVASMTDSNSPAEETKTTTAFLSAPSADPSSAKGSASDVPKNKATPKASLSPAPAPAVAEVVPAAKAPVSTKAPAATTAPVVQPATDGLSGCRNAPALPKPVGTVVSVSTEVELQAAVVGARSGSTILIAPGTYALTSTLNVKTSNVTIRGNSSNCTDVVLRGRGMDNSNYRSVPHGIWTNVPGLVVQNLSITEVYYHSINFNVGSQSPRLYNLNLTNAGQQFIKANVVTWGKGVNNGVVDYVVAGYPTTIPQTDHGSGIGYTGGVDVHGGNGWVISNGKFYNFHAGDTASHLWSPVILMWRGSSNTVAENNIFENVDRAIAFGLDDSSEGYDHWGGRISGNILRQTSGLFSPFRRSNSDAGILVWNSPGTVVENNNCTSNNTWNLCIEFRWDTTGAVARNNVGDKPTGSRSGSVFAESGTTLN